VLKEIKTNVIVNAEDVLDDLVKEVENALSMKMYKIADTLNQIDATLTSLENPEDDK